MYRLSFTHISTHILQGKHFKPSWGEAPNREQGEIRTLAACFFLWICVCGRGRYTGHFLLCLLSSWLHCKNNIFPQPIFQHSNTQTRCTSQAGPPVNTAEFTHLQCLTWIFISCSAHSRLWPHILINGTWMSFTKCTKRDDTSQSSVASRESTASFLAAGSEHFYGRDCRERCTSLFGLFFTVWLRRIRITKERMSRQISCFCLVNLTEK